MLGLGSFTYSLMHNLHFRNFFLTGDCNNLLNPFVQNVALELLAALQNIPNDSLKVFYTYAIVELNFITVLGESLILFNFSVYFMCLNWVFIEFICKSAVQNIWHVLVIFSMCWSVFHDQSFLV